ncbi:YIM1 Protein YIM1 [Candida maltosa Xu316]
MIFTTSKLTYKAYTYKTRSSPIKITTKTIDLVPDSQSPSSFVAPPGKILIKVNYVALNPFDTKLYSMAIWPISTNSGIGRDFSGEIISIGQNTSSGFKICDLVQGIYPLFYDSQGTLSEYLLVSPRDIDIGVIPKNMSLIDAASRVTVFGTTVSISEELGFKGKKVLILGGGTSVGRYLVQLTHQFQAKEVVVTCSGRTQTTIENLGADKIIDYTKHENLVTPILDSVKETGSFDYIIDCYGGNQLFPKIKTILTRNGSYYTLAVKKVLWSMIKVNLRQVWSKMGLLGYKYKFVQFIRFEKDLMKKSLELLETGKFETFIDSVYPFDQLDQAIEKLESGKTSGKVVVEVAKE